MGTVAAGSELGFSTSVGKHNLCLVPKAPDCGKEGTVRSVILHEGWTLKVKPGRPT